MFLMRIACWALLLLPAALMGQSYNYTLSWTHAASHLYEVSLKTAPAPEGFSDFQIPAWRPGRYYIQDYAAGVSAFQAFDANGAKLSFSKVDANTWRVPTPAAGGEIEVRYQFYANTMDAGSSVLNKAQAYFNPVNFFMHLRNDCISNCPAGALDEANFSLPKCLAYRKLPDAKCHFTCLARVSCPVGSEHRYSAEQLHHTYSISLRYITQNLVMK